MAWDNLVAMRAYDLCVAHTVIFGQIFGYERHSYGGRAFPCNEDLIFRMVEGRYPGEDESKVYAGLYIPDPARLIFISDRAKFNDPYWVSRLGHECGHDVQDQNGVFHSLGHKGREREAELYEQALMADMEEADVYRTGETLECLIKWQSGVLAGRYPTALGALREAEAERRNSANSSGGGTLLGTRHEEPAAPGPEKVNGQYGLGAPGDEQDAAGEAGSYAGNDAQFIGIDRAREDSDEDVILRDAESLANDEDKGGC